VLLLLLLLLLLLQIDLPPPTLLKPLELWTGKQLFGLLVRPNAATR
jgi:DNA-directed RNA polymerase III subunit RPC1